MNRRAFLRSLLSEAEHFHKEMQGIPQLRLSDIKQLPDDKVSQMMPMITEGYDVSVDKTRVRVYHRKSGTTIHEIVPKPANIFVVTLFNGMTPLGEIGRQLAAKMRWEEQQGFARAKDLFLTLVDCGVCRPSNTVGRG